MDGESRGLGRAEGGLVLELLDSRYIPSRVLMKGLNHEFGLV
jgi:hypothetical protein